MAVLKGCQEGKATPKLTEIICPQCGEIVEVGAAGNTRQEALFAVEVLADSIAAIAHGTAGEMS